MKDFKDRVLIPLAIPLGALAIIAVVVLNISRVLLALEERSGPHTVVALAVIIASAVLFGCTYIASKGEERSGGSMALLSVAGLVLVLAGFTGFEAIAEDQKIEKDKEKAAAATEAKPDFVVTAFDLGFKPKEFGPIAPGKVTVQEVNDGATAHTFVIEGATGGKKLSVPAHGAKDMSSYDLKAGSYTFFCDIPGHRQAGMQGTLTVT